MLDTDEAAWRAIDAGERQVSWADFIGDLQGASYLTVQGRGVATRMATDLTDFLGSGWLPKAIGSSDTRGRIPWLGRFSPALSILGGQQGAAGAFVEVLRWWACLQMALRHPGVGRVRRDTRSDVSIDRLLHTLTQTRLGAIASTLDFQVRFEPPAGGDLEISDGQTVVTVEVFSMGTPLFVAEQESVSREMFDHLDSLSRRHDVHFHGALPGLNADIDAWKNRTTLDAAKASGLHLSLAVVWEGAELLVEPGPAPTGASLDGPSTEGDIGARIARHATTKARQVSNSTNGWLWIENQGAVDMRSPVFHAPLADQLHAYEALLRPVLGDPLTPFLEGLTFSGAGKRQWPPRGGGAAGDSSSARREASSWGPRGPYPWTGSGRPSNSPEVTLLPQH